MSCPLCVNNFITEFRTSKPLFNQFFQRYILTWTWDRIDNKKDLFTFEIFVSILINDQAVFRLIRLLYCWRKAFIKISRFFFSSDGFLTRLFFCKLSFLRSYKPCWSYRQIPEDIHLLSIQKDLRHYELKNVEQLNQKDWCQKPGNLCHTREGWEQTA